MDCGAGHAVLLIKKSPYPRGRGERGLTRPRGEDLAGKRTRKRVLFPAFCEASEGRSSSADGKEPESRED